MTRRVARTVRIKAYLAPIRQEGSRTGYLRRVISCARKLDKPSVVVVADDGHGHGDGYYDDGSSELKGNG